MKVMRRKRMKRFEPSDLRPVLGDRERRASTRHRLSYDRLAVQPRRTHRTPAGCTDSVSQLDLLLRAQYRPSVLRDSMERRQQPGSADDQHLYGWTMVGQVGANRCLEVECPLAESAAPNLNDASSTCHRSPSIPPHRLSPRPSHVPTSMPRKLTRSPSRIGSGLAVRPAARSLPPPLCIWPRHKHL